MTKTKQNGANRRIGYARVSTTRQDEAAQIAALSADGCDQIFHERISTRVPAEKRKQLQACLAMLRPCDELVVAKLDRLGRTQVEVINCLHQLQEQGVDVRTLDGLINTAGLGKFAPVVVGMLSGLAEVERELIRERTQESIEHRRATGGNLGGRPKSYRPERAELVLDLKQRGMSLREIATATGLSKSAVGRITAAAAAEAQA